jgi:CRP-like cAMP-binding protein
MEIVKLDLLLNYIKGSRGMKTLISLFSEKFGLNTCQIERLSALLKIKELSKKDHLIRQGTVCNFIGFVSSGTLRSYIKNNEGEYNNDFYFDNDVVSAYTSFLTRMPTNCNIEALTDSIIYYISYDDLETLADQDITFLKLSKHISDAFFIRKCKRETSFLKDSAAERLERLSLLYPGIEQRVSQYHIASYLGVKPESLSRIKLLTYINK